MELACVLFAWGDTLMSEDGPAETPMALWPEVRAIDGAEVVLRILAARYRIAVATNATISDCTSIRCLGAGSALPLLGGVLRIPGHWPQLSVSGVVENRQGWDAPPCRLS